MGVFDFKTFLNVAGEQGGNPLAAAGASFGVPSCMLNLAADLLAAIPSPILGDMRDTIQAGTSLADEVVKSVFSKLFSIFGIIEWDSEEGGLVFVTNQSKNGADKDNASVLDAINGLVGAATNTVGSLYANYEMLSNQIEFIKNCIASYRDYLKFKNGNAGNQVPTDPQAFDDFMNSTYAAEKYQVEIALKFIDGCNASLSAIDSVLSARQSNPALEPIFKCDNLEYVSGTFLETNCAPPQEVDKEIFRLVFGPPKSTFGQFILSNDGLYFDSQSSGITPALTYIDQKKAKIATSNFWKFNQDPNIGGRGKGFSTRDVNLYINTILDPNIINESKDLQIYYDKDGFLQELIGNKNKRIYDLSAQLNTLELDGAPTSVILNLKQSLISESSTLNQQINKRKKQIELAVALPAIYNPTVSYAPGEVPINDFSYLGGMNISIDLQKQKSLVFSQVDISGVVSPIKLNPTYVVPKTNTKNSSTEHLIIAENGTGAIIYDGSSVSSTDAVILQTENFLTSDNLFAMYNFLNTNVEVPSSTVFTARNSASITDKNYAQLVGDSPATLFSRGLGVPYLHGITRHSSVNYAAPESVGSYVKLPNAKEFNDLLYDRNDGTKGTTIDFWAHVPNLDLTENGFNAGGVSGLYRLVLANENVGFQGDGSSTNTEYVRNNFGTETVRGFMMGFTRDQRLTSNEGATNSQYGNLVRDAAFFIAPTQSTSLSAVALINRSYYDSEDCVQDTRYHAMVQPINEVVSGVAFSSCGSKFCHIAVTFNPKEDEVSFYFDGVKTTTSSISYVFGTPKYHMPNLPTFKKSNSFQYSTDTVGPYASNDLKAGPKLDTYFTPWIVGGGYTDGMYQYGNFMGGQYGGTISGLKGYLGSLKFYTKSLEPNEVLNNYNTQKSFFKNIDTVGISWEPIISL